MSSNGRLGPGLYDHTAADLRDAIALIGRIQLALLGTLPLAEARAAGFVSNSVSVQRAIAMGWSVCSAAFGRNINDKLYRGPVLETMLRTTS